MGEWFIVWGVFLVLIGSNRAERKGKPMGGCLFTAVPVKPPPGRLTSFRVSSASCFWLIPGAILILLRGKPAPFSLLKKMASLVEKIFRGWALLTSFPCPSPLSRPQEPLAPLTSAGFGFQERNCLCTSSSSFSNLCTNGKR